MDHIDKVLATSSDSPHQFSLAIRAALAIGKRAMNRYYTKTDHSDVYRIAMGTKPFHSLLLPLTTPLVLHPRHKLEYFIKQKWETPWIQDAREIVRREFDRSYAASATVHSQRDDVQAASRGSVSHTNSRLSKSLTFFISSSPQTYSIIYPTSHPCPQSSMTSLTATSLLPSRMRRNL